MHCLRQRVNIRTRALVAKCSCTMPRVFVLGRRERGERTREKKSEREEDGRGTYIFQTGEVVQKLISESTSWVAGH